MSEKKKVLIVLVNYGDEQLNYLKNVVDELKSFKKYNVTIIIQSNIPLDINEVDKINILVELEDYQLLPLTCRKVIWEKRFEYDIFIYGENDHLFKEIHIDKHLEYEEILPEKYISGLIQFEENIEGKYYPGYHFDFDWDYNSVVNYGNKLFAHFNNVHQATFILTQNQLLRVGKKINFNKLVVENSQLKKIKRKIRKKIGLKVERINKYSVKCKVNTDIYEYAGMKKLICISEFEDNLIHHLPNIYIEGLKGRQKLRSSQEKMEKALNKLMRN